MNLKRKTLLSENLKKKNLNSRINNAKIIKGKKIIK